MGIILFPPWFLALTWDRATLPLFPSISGHRATHAPNLPWLLGVIPLLTECESIWPHRMVVILALLHGTRVVPASQDGCHPGTSSRKQGLFRPNRKEIFLDDGIMRGSWTLKSV